MDTALLHQSMIKIKYQSNRCIALLSIFFIGFKNTDIDCVAATLRIILKNIQRKKTHTVYEAKRIGIVM